MSVPNQKKIIIERSSDTARKDFLKVSNENLNLAMYYLTAKAFILWIYFCDNQNGYQLDLYPSDFMKKTGLSRSTYDRAFEELEEKGYLKKSKVYKNYYLFNEVGNYDFIPKNDEIISLDKDDLEEVKKKLFE